MRNIYLITFIFLILFSSSIKAEDEIEGSIGNNIPNFSTEAISEFIDYNKSNNIENGFSPHRMNYLLPVTITDYTKLRESKETKFQLSIKQRLFKFYGWAIYFAFTQKSFWQLYDTDDSSPFRENDFNPDLFIRTKMWIGIRTDFGIEHESNGKNMPDSRSWNRIYLHPYFENNYLITSFKFWYRISEDKKKDCMDSNGDDNPDISHYYGYGELKLTAKFQHLWNTWFSGSFRYNPKWNKGSAEMNLTVPIPANSMKLMVQYWYGYGESLIDYNIRQSKVGFGLCFTR